MAATSADRVASFEDYLRRMQPWVLRITKRHAREGHPYLSQRDLIQDGFIRLWELWQKYGESLPPDELGRVGTTGVVRIVMNRMAQARAYGRGSATVASLDDEANGFATRWVGDDGCGIFARLSLQEIERGLPALERRLLQELLAPGSDLTARLRVLQETGATRRSLSMFSQAILAEILGVSLMRLRQAWRRLAAVVEHLDDDLLTGVSEVGYNKVDRSTSNKEVTTMSDVTAMFPQDEEESSTTAKASTKAKASTTAKASKAKAPAKAPTKAKASKASKPRAKASKGENAKRTTKKPAADALAVDTKVEYLGGSRCAWLKKGQKGVVKRYHVNPGGSFRYGVNFEFQGKTRSTQLATQYVKKAA